MKSFVGKKLLLEKNEINYLFNFCQMSFFSAQKGAPKVSIQNRFQFAFALFFVKLLFYPLHTMTLKKGFIKLVC